MGALLWLPVVLAAQTKPEGSCAVSGQVSNVLTGEPVRRALVSLRRIDMSPAVTTIQTTQTVPTDAEGRFAMAGIAPGKYWLGAERTGFIATQYGSRGPGKSGTLLTLEPGQKSSDLAMRLTPHGVITGRVLDEEGEPVTGANVQVSRQIYAQGRKQMSRAGASSTNDLGEYRVFGLAPGRYFVSADARQNPMLPEAEDEYVTTWHPRTADAAAAAPIEVAAGAQLRSIDILLAKLHTVAVRGRVVSEAGSPGGGQGAQRTNFNVMLVARNAMGAPGNTSRGTAVTPEGTFDFRSVTPGSYFLIAQVNAQGKNFAARMTIQVGGASIEGITLPIRGGMPVSGRVRVEGETTQSIASVQVMLRPAETGGLVFGPLPSQQVKPDGSFQMDDVGADRYAISFSGVPEGFYVKGVRSGNLDVQADGLEVAGLSPAPLDVVLSPNAGQVTGTVLDPRTQKAALAMMVVLVPQEKERRDRETFYRTTTSDLSGKFTFKSVVPGEYRAYVWEEEVEYGAWMDPDFMKPLESRGEAVSVSEGGRHAVQVNLISADAQ
jgi:protocatechuate 3,4-dioxygenase beta subunit